MESRLPLRVLVYGFYGKDNLGDDLFIEAFRALFPQYQFTFTDQITRKQLRETEALFIGGGSLLDGPISMTDEARSDLGASRPILYIGVGTETSVHPDHQKLLSRAWLVATRSWLDNTLKHPNMLHCPDIVYALKGNISAQVPDKKLLFLPNACVVPNYNDAHWKHVAWAAFKSECAQFLDEAALKGYEVTFYAMCQNQDVHDLWAAGEIRNMMTHKAVISTYHCRSFHQTMAFISKFSTVVTQRYHGIVLADLAQRSAVSIWHHDKLRTGSRVPYYGVTKQALHQQLESTIYAPCDRDFSELKRVVEHKLSCVT